MPATYAGGCHSDSFAAPAITCDFGDPDGELTVALVGDSKISQWASVIDSIGKARGWRVISLLKSACAFADGAPKRADLLSTSCLQWNERGMAKLAQLAPDVILVNQGAFRALTDPNDAASPETSEAMVLALESRWKRLVESGIPVVTFLDNPAPSQQIPECVAQHRSSLNECTFTARTLVANVQRAAAARVPGVGVLDINDGICPGGKCPAVIGNEAPWDSRQGSPHPQGVCRLPSPAARADDCFSFGKRLAVL